MENCATVTGVRKFTTPLLSDGTGHTHIASIARGLHGSTFSWRPAPEPCHCSHSPPQQCQNYNGQPSAGHSTFIVLILETLVTTLSLIVFPKYLFILSGTAEYDRKFYETWWFSKLAYTAGGPQLELNYYPNPNWKTPTLCAQNLSRVMRRNFGARIYTEILQILGMLKIQWHCTKFSTGKAFQCMPKLCRQLFGLLPTERFQGTRFPHLLISQLLSV